MKKFRAALFYAGHWPELLSSPGSILNYVAGSSRQSSNVGRLRWPKTFRWLLFNPGTQSAQDMTYFDYLNRLAPLVAFLRQIGVWAFPHPWVSLFVPAANAETLIGETLSPLTVDDVGQGPILIYPFNRELFRTPFFRVPDSSHFFVFALLCNAVPPTTERATQLVEANRALFDRATTLGGKRYPFDSVPMTRHDWQKHYQPLWGAFVSAKRRFDPDGILTPGQGIF